MVLFCLWNHHFSCLILLTSNLFVLLSMRSSNQIMLNQLRMRKPRKILLHQLLVSSLYTIMLIDGTLILPETCLLDITNVKGKICSHLKELQTGQLNLTRLRHFERLLWLLKTKLSKWLRMIGELLMIQSVRLISFGKAGLNLLWFQSQLAEDLKANNRHFQLFRICRKLSLQEWLQLQLNRNQLLIQPCLKVIPWIHQRQLLEELAVAGDNIDQVKEILLRYWEQPDPTTGLPYTHDFWLKCPLFWLRFHYEPRTTLFTPRELDLIGGPSLEDLGSQRMTLCVTSVGNIWKHDTWTVDKLEVFEPFTGLTLFDLSEKDVYDPPPLPEVDIDTSAHVPRSLQVPKEPTAQERAEHELTHSPFRSWCKTCVMSKSRQDHSKKLRLKQPVLQCDYSFFTDPKVEGSVTILNVRDVMSGLALACVVPNKGRSVYAEGELRRFILETGRTFGVLQADPEPSLVALAETVTSELGGLSLRKSPTEWKQAQGAVGNSQQLLYAQVRTLRQDLADRYGTLVPITSPVFTWLVKHAQFLLNNFAIRSDGLTPFERRWSKRYTSALCKFGEIVLCRLRGKQPKADPSWVPGLWLGRDTSADMHVVGTTSGVFKTRSIRRLPVSEQVDKQLLKDFQAKPWDPKGRGEDTDVLVLPQAPEIQGLPPLPVQQTDGTSAVDLSQHGLKRTSDELGNEAQEVEPPNLFQHVGPAQSDLKRSAPDSVPGSETKLQRISAVFEDDSLPVACACVASISTKSGLDVPIEPNVDREEELQALRAAEPVIWYDTEFDREQEIAGMNKEMTSIKDFDVYEEKLITECTSEQLENAISTKWVKRAKGDGVKCRVCVRGYDQEVDPDDTYASTPSLITLKLLLTLAVAHGWHILAGDVSTAFLHALLTDEVFVIPPVEYYPNGGVLWKLRKAMYGLKQSPRMWQQHFASVAASLGFERLKSDSNLYFHPERRCYMLCYVDDLLIFGDKKTTEFLFSELQKQLCLRSEGWRCTWTRYFDQFSWTLHHPTWGLHWNVNADFLHWQNAWTTWHVEM